MMAVFLLLSFALSWWSWWIPALHLPVFAVGPLIAAVVVKGLRSPANARDLLRRSVQWRTGLEHYAVVFVIPVLLVVLSATTAVALGAWLPSGASILSSSRLLLLFPVLLLVPGAGGAWSEPGWRGVALPWLLDRASPFVGTLCLGVIVALWHLPLVVEGRQPFADLPWIVVWSFLFTWVFVRSGGNIFLAVLLHAWDDTLWNFCKSLFAGADVVVLAWSHVGIYALASMVLVWATPYAWFTSRHKRLAERK